MRRGNLITIAVSGDYGKPRPALVVQANDYEDLPSVTVLPLTSDLHDDPLLRVNVAPAADTGLNRPSQVMVDKILTVPIAKAGRAIGRLDDRQMAHISRTLAVFLGLA